MTETKKWIISFAIASAIFALAVLFPKAFTAVAVVVAILGLVGIFAAAVKCVVFDNN